jgi:aspartyl-tRNA(Asn)/glutamyl-tRNA(Gln) amidotransferase subunit A
MTPCFSDRRTFLAAGAGAAASLWWDGAFGQSRDVTGLSLTEAAALLRRRDVSATELTRACLDRIATYDRSLNSFITVTADEALDTARERDEETRSGTRRGPLHGIPVAVKDNMDTEGIRTTGASELFRDRVPSEDAEVVRRLKGAGAVLLGKTNLHEFAYGGSSAVSAFGPVRNPWALERVPGGSSGGSAAAVSANFCFAALGTDTAASVRMPASYCGIVGLKPTYGRVSNRGVLPLSWTLDHVGPLCRTVADTALVLSVIAGFDPLEPTSADLPVPDYERALETDTTKLRLGVPRARFFDDLEPEIATAVDAALRVIRAMTASVEDVALPALELRAGMPLHRAILGPEAFAYHSEWLDGSGQKYQPSTLERIRQFAAAVTTQDYVTARRRCELLRREIASAFAAVDILVTPTVPGIPAPISPIEQQAGLDVGRTRNLWPFDVLGLPAVSVPCGFTSSGLPIGLQIVGAPFAEATVLGLAHAYEQATDWHRRRPPLRA